MFGISKEETQLQHTGGENGGLSPRDSASRGLTQMFGLHIQAATLTVLVDLMVFGMDTVSLETLAPLGVVVAAVLGFIVYRIQRKSYGDDHDTALNKALIIGLLTAIPVPLTPLIAIPGGVIGIVRAIRHK
jgi:Na+-translocating ferredoxin:NAD+ oxidoreductase RnfD subunit